MFSFSSSRMGSALLGRSTMRQLGSSSMQGHFNGETCRWNQIKKLKWLTLTSGTNETKAYVYSRRMATPFGMVTTDENVGGHRDASSSDTRIPNVIGDWTSQALHHPSCEEGQEGLQHVAMTLWEEGCPACDTGYSQYQTSVTRLMAVPVLPGPWNKLKIMEKPSQESNTVSIHKEDFSADWTASQASCCGPTFKRGDKQKGRLICGRGRAALRSACPGFVLVTFTGFVDVSLHRAGRAAVLGTAEALWLKDGSGEFSDTGFMIKLPTNTDRTTLHILISHFTWETWVLP